MTETPDTTPESATAGTKKRGGGGITSMLLPELKALAGALGISGARSMKKAQLLDAIKAHQAGQPTLPKQDAPAKQAPPAKEAPTKVEEPAAREEPAQRPPREERAPREEKVEPEKQPEKQPDRQSERPPRERNRQDRDRQQDRQPEKQTEKQPEKQPEQDRQQANQRGGQQDRQQDKQQDRRQGNDQNKNDQGKQQDRNQQDRNQRNQNQRNQNDAAQPGQGNPNGNPNANPGSQQDGLDDDEDGDGSRRNRRRRGRDRDRTRAGARNEPDTTILEDDVLVPAAGILDVLDNYAFVRTSGYLAGPDDVYLSLSMVRKYGLRRGDAIVGQVRQPREGERKEKFNPMVHVETVNGADPDAAKHRDDFTTMTPLHPTSRLRLETGPDDLVGRFVDLAAPIGKGSRGLLVAPPGAGTTTLLRAIATSVTANNPECHLMVVLLDERPEDVTDFRRSVKGEVVASEFDRPPADHAAVAELAIERAKRLVELGHDVVVLLDAITSLGRALNLSAPANGRALAGGVDAASLFPPKRFFGAARNLEDGGSLTILAVASVDSGSVTDALVMEELVGTENLVLRLREDLAARRLWPAIDVAGSSTRRLEQLVGQPEAELLWKLHTLLSALEPADAYERLLDRVRHTQTNVELLTAVQKGAGLR